MSYIVYERVECPYCLGRDRPAMSSQHCFCRDGYDYTECDLLDVLKKVRWGKVLEEGAFGTLSESHSFENLRIED